MTKRYDLTLRLDTDTGQLIDINLTNKTMGTVQQVIRLAMSDFEKVEPLPPQKHKWGRSKGSKRVDPPIEIIPTEDDIKDV